MSRSAGLRSPVGIDRPDRPRSKPLPPDSRWIASTSYTQRCSHSAALERATPSHAGRARATFKRCDRTYSLSHPIPCTCSCPAEAPRMPCAALRATCAPPHCHGSLVRALGNLLICSPELCFLQMASTMPFHRLVKLGYELCALYTLQPDGAAGYGRPSLQPPFERWNAT